MTCQLCAVIYCCCFSERDCFYFWHYY